MYVIAAIAAGVLIGRIRGGRVRTIATADLRGVSFLAVGAAIQVVGVLFVSGGAGIALLVLSYGFIGAFTAVNLHRSGMGVVLVGLAMNALVIGINGGMPVRSEAIVAAGIAEHDEIDDLEIGGKRHLEDEDDTLTFLGDIIPVPIPFAKLSQVISFGDLVLVVGVADVIANLMRPRRPHERAIQPEREASASPDSDSEHEASP